MLSLCAVLCSRQQQSQAEEGEAASPHDTALDTNARIRRGKSTIRRLVVSSAVFGDSKGMGPSGPNAELSKLSPTGVSSAVLQLLLACLQLKPQCQCAQASSWRRPSCTRQGLA